MAIQVGRLLGLLFHLLVASVGIASYVFCFANSVLSWKSPTAFTLWSLNVQIFASLVFIWRDFSVLLTITSPTTPPAPKPGMKKRVSFADDLYSVTFEEGASFAIFHTSFIMSCATGLLFWGIYSIDPEGLVPKNMYYPDLLNHCHHTFQPLFAVAELFVYAYNETDVIEKKLAIKGKMEKIGMICVTVMGLIYAVFIIFFHLFTGLWPYPFMNIFNLHHFFLFCAVNLMAFLFLSKMTSKVLCNISRSISLHRQASSVKVD